MYLNVKRSYGQNDQQLATGRFLVLFCKEPGETIWGVVRHCKMSQCGHFMMGVVRIGDQSITVSGLYGSDGLVMNINKVDRLNRKYLTEMPSEISDRHWESTGGHGNPVDGIYEWAESIDRRK